MMDNSVYGKKLENLTNRVDVNLVSNAKDYQRFVSRSSFSFSKDI